MSLNLTKLSPKAREEVAQALQELSLKAEVDPLSFYFPHKRQKIFHAFTAKLRVFLGGTQSGKTSAGLTDDLIQALPEKAVPKHLRRYKTHDPALDGPFLCRIMAPSFPVLETTLYEKLRALTPASELAGGSWGTAYDPRLRVLHFACGSKFFFATYEQEVTKMGGATLQRVHMDEEPPKPHFDEARFRVARYDGDLLLTMTPTEGISHMYETVWERRGDELRKGVFRRMGEGVDRPDLEVVTVDMDDNPALSKEAKRLALEGLSREERAMRKQGRFVALHGRIYEDFRGGRHVIPEMDQLPEFINVVVGIDPGVGESACACIWAYLTADDEMVVFQEAYLEGETVATAAKMIHQVNASHGIRPIYHVIDPAARNREHTTGRSVQMEFADHGIVCVAGQNDVPAGINRIKERLQRENGLLITANCRRLVKEFEQYRWRNPPRTGEDGKPRPFKRNDHGLDALRYIAMSRPYLPIVNRTEPLTELEQMMKDHQAQGNPKPGYGHVGHAA